MARNPYGMPKIPTAEDLMRKAMPKGFKGPDRRKKARLSTATLNKLGLDAPGLKDADLPNADTRSAFTKVLDTLDVPRNAVFNAISWLGDVPTHKLRKGALGMKVVTGSDVLRHLGVKNKAVLGVGGLAADIFGDPLTYLGLGATTGLSIGKHAPKLLKPAVASLKGTGRAMAGLGGKIAPGVAKALGRSPERLAAIGKRMTRMAGKALPDAQGLVRPAMTAEAVAKRLMTKRGGQLTRRLARQVNRPGYADAARKFFAAGGEKGRTLFRAPFAASGITAPIGKRKRLWETFAGIRPDETLAKLTGHAAEMKGYAGKVTAGTSAVKNLKAAQAARPKVLPPAIQKRITDAIKAKGKVVSSAEAAKIEQDILHYAAGAPYPVKRGTRSAIAQGKKAAAKIAELQAKIKTAKTHPEASLPFKLEAEARLGKVYGVAQEGEGWLKGAGRTLGLAKQKAFGGGSNTLSRLGAGMEQGIGGASTAEGEAMKPVIASMLKPLAAKIAKAKNLPADDVSKSLWTYVAHHASPRRAAKKLYATDPAIATVQKVAGWLGPDDLKQARHITAVVADLDRKGFNAQRAAGLPVARNESLLSFVPTEAAAKSAAEKGKRLPKSYTSPKVGRLDIEIADPALRKTLKRSKAEGLHWTDSNKLMVLTSNTAQVKKMRKLIEAGRAKSLGTKALSGEQWNAWRKLGKDAPGGKIFTSDFTGPQFKQDIGESVAAWTKKSRQAVTAGELRDVALQEGAKFPADWIHKDTPGFGHMVPMSKIKADIQGSPLLETIGKQLPDDLNVPQPVAKMFERMGQVSKPNEMSQILRLMNYPMRIWKPIALGHPGYMMRNVVQNYMGMAYQGINPAKATKKMFELKKLVQAVNSGKSVAGITINIGGKMVPAEKIVQQARLYNMMNSGFVSMVMNPGMYGKIKDSMPKLGKWWFAVNNNIETTMRMSAWLTLVDQGMDFRQAALKTITAMPDLTDLTHFEKGMRNVFPWFSWMRKNTANVARVALEKPSILPGTEHLRQAIQTSLVGENKIEEGLRPDWMQQQQAMQISGDDKMGNVWLLASWLPFQDLMNILEGTQNPAEFARGVLGQVRPDAKVFAEMATGSDIFRNKPITPFTTQELFTTMMVPKALLGRSGTALDNLLALRAPREIGRIAMDMPTVGGAIGRGTIGGAIQPLTRERALYERMRALTEEGKKLRNAIKKAEAVGDNSAIPGLAKRWAQVQAEMYRLGLPGVAKSTQKSLTVAGVTAGEPAFAER